MTNQPSRKPNRLSQFDYTQNGAYFVTVCTRERKPILWRPSHSDLECRGGSYPPAESDHTFRAYLSPVGLFVDEAIRRIPDSYPCVYLDRYCIMPNHVHLLIRIQSSETDGRIRSAPTVSTIVGQTKRLAAKWAGESIWQKSFHDHVIRNEQDYVETMRYIDNNLLRQIEHIPKGM